MANCPLRLADAGVCTTSLSHVSQSHNVLKRMLQHAGAEDDSDKLLVCTLVVVNEVISALCMAFTLLEVDAALCKQDLCEESGFLKDMINHDIYESIKSASRDSYC